jgi:hypothetical protein
MIGRSYLASISDPCTGKMIHQCIQVLYDMKYHHLNFSLYHNPRYMCNRYVPESTSQSRQSPKPSVSKAVSLQSRHPLRQIKLQRLRIPSLKTSFPTSSSKYQPSSPHSQAPSQTYQTDHPEKPNTPLTNEWKSVSSFRPVSFELLVKASCSMRFVPDSLTFRSLYVVRWLELVLKNRVLCVVFFCSME